MSQATFANKESKTIASKTKATAKNASGGLRIGEANDAFEREADRVADEVMAGGNPRRDWSLAGVSVEPVTFHVPCADRVSTLDPDHRRSMEHIFRRDFSNVHIHADQEAAKSARAMNAGAYSSGTGIFFGSGQYAPGTKSGRKLLAHELTHLVQGANGSSRPESKRSSVSELEREAENVSIAVGNGYEAPPIYGVAHPAIGPLKGPPSPTTETGTPTFGNLPRDEPLQGSLRKVVELKEIDGVWYEESPRAPRSRASGSYDFVVQDGRVLGVKSQGPFGHTEAARGQRESYAGQVEFGGPGGKRGVVTRWSNASGHYAPVAAFSENAVRAGLPSDKFVPYQGPKAEQGPQLPVLQPELGGGPGAKPQGSPAAAIEGETPAATTPRAQPVEGETPASRARAVGEPLGEHEQPRGISGGLEAPAPGLTTSLGFAALSFGAGVGTSLLQGERREKILGDLAKLPQPRVDRRGAAEFFKDPATAAAIRLLDVLSKDIKPFIATFPPQHEKTMTTAQFQMMAMALLPSKSSADYEKRFSRIDTLADQMAAYDEQISTVQSNLEALLSLESKAKQTKAAADDLIAKLPAMFSGQNVASEFGVAPSPDAEDYSKLESNLRYISVSIAMVFADAHAAKPVIDRAAREVSMFRSDLRQVWWNEFGEQLAHLTKEQEKAKGGNAPQSPKRVPAQAHATPPGVHLEATPRGFPSLEEQRGKGRCPTCHDEPNDASKGQWHSMIPDELRPKMTPEQWKQWIQKGQ